MVSLVLVVICFGVAYAVGDGVWGENRGCLRMTADRSSQLSQVARPIGPLTDKDAVELSFRFRTVGGHTYGALLFVGIHAAEADFKTDGLGVVLHRHSDAHGFVAYPFVADSQGTLHTAEDARVGLEYGTLYDVMCRYSTDERRLTASFRTLDGSEVGATQLSLSADITFAADRLAVWNYADGYPKVARTSRLTVLLDRLGIQGETPMSFDRDLSEMPERTGKGGEWYQPPLPPLFSTLRSPRDVVRGDDLPVSVNVRPGEAGPVQISLCRFDGRAFLKRQTEIEQGTASVRFSASDLEPLPRGEAAVAVSLGDGAPTIARTVFLHGRSWNDALSAPPVMQAGDHIEIRDMGLFESEKPFADVSRKGVWWRREYTLEDDPRPRHMLCVEAHDPAHPESCLAPPVRLPLRLTGWYEVWVTTYRGTAGGGVDVRLSDEPYFQHLDPHQVDTTGGEAADSRMVEMRFRACDLTGRELIFQQPYGTHESETKLCNAAIAGVRLVRLSDEQADQARQELETPEHKRIGFDNDGYSYFWRWGTHDRACIARLIEPLRTLGGAFLNLSLGGLGGLTIPTPYTELFQLRGHVRDGDFRANEFFRWCRDHEVNIVNVLAERAHEVGVDLFVSTMMERCYSPDRFVREHPDWRVVRGRGTWDYANPDVREFQIRKIAWICEHHDIDGFIVDYTRYGHFFNEDEAGKFAHMNAFVRGLRAAVDQVNEKKERKVLLCASFGDDCWFLRNWGSGKLADQGLDVDTWLREGIFDRIMPEGPTCLKWVERARDSRTDVWPRKVRGVTLTTDDKLHGELGPLGLTEVAHKAFSAGAPGMFFFNHEPWSSLARLGIRDELPLRAITDTPYGIREQGVPTFRTWFPDYAEREEQRKAFDPLVLPVWTAPEGGNWNVKVVNAFEKDVTIQMTWGGQALSKGLVADPASLRQTAEAGSSVAVSGRLGGSLQVPLDPGQLYLDVVFRHAEMDVFRHRLPVRVVQSVIPGKDRGVPISMDARTSDTVTLARDDEHLIVRWRRKADVHHGEPRTVDAYRTIRKKTHIEILVDPDGTEKSFFQFLVSARGDRADARWPYSSFHGRHVRKADWDGTWDIDHRAHDAADDESALSVKLPFDTLGGVPETGGRWRLAITLRKGDGDQCRWPVNHRADPARFGLLVFD